MIASKKLKNISDISTLTKKDILLFLTSVARIKFVHKVILIFKHAGGINAN